MQRSKAARLVVVVLMLGVAGCGGSDSVTKAEFVRQADAKCKQVQTKITSIMVSAQSGEGGGKSNVELASEAVALRVSLTKDLAAVDAPESLAADYDRFIEVRRTIDGYTQKAVDAAAPDSKGEAEAGTSEADFTQRGSAEAHESASLATKLGLKVCTV